MQPMINAVYQLIAPRMIDVTYQEMHLSGSQVLIRPLYLSICHADQRYYQDAFRGRLEGEAADGAHP